MSLFADLGLGQKTLRAVSDLGYETPTPIQEKTIPLVLEGCDVIAAAQTGTGKTAAFALPCMDRLEFAGKGAGPSMLVITPTRELAAQIGEVCEAIAKRTRHSVLTVVGGLSYRPQIEGLERGCDVLIATPGRLEDLIGQGAADLSLVTTLVLDEADRMLDMGFLPAVERIVDATNPDRQTLMFSATIDKEVRRISKRMLRDPELVEVARKGETEATVNQYIVRISHAAKPSLLAAILREHGGDRVIVFARTRHRADSCCRRVRKAGFTADVIHSGRSQNQRKRALEDFAKGRVGVLIATDVLARGIDVEQVSYVVNFDLPAAPEDYIHRIGRTGRAGQEGMAISFVSPETEDALRDIQKLTGQKLEELEVADFDKEAAEAEAADRLLQNTLRREKDPEVAKVMKEMAAADKAKRKKAKSREAKAGKSAGAKGREAAEKKPVRAKAKRGAAAVEKPAGAKPKRSRSDEAKAKRASAARPPKRASGKAAKVSAERYEARLTAVEDERASRRNSRKRSSGKVTGMRSSNGRSSGRARSNGSSRKRS